MELLILKERHFDCQLWKFFCISCFHCISGPMLNKVVSEWWYEEQLRPWWGGGVVSRRTTSRDRKRDAPSCCCAYRAKERQQTAGGDGFKSRGQAFSGEKNVQGSRPLVASHSSSPPFMAPQFSASSLSPKLVKDVDELQQRRSDQTHARQSIKVKRSAPPE